MITKRTANRFEREKCNWQSQTERGTMATSSKLDMLRNYATARGWSIEPGKPIPHGEQLVVTDGALKVPVTYYPKSASLVFGGAASPLKAALQVWAHGLDSAQPPSYAAVQQGNPETTGRRPMQANGEGFPLGSPVIAGPHIGIDEAGKGDWFGPLVVAAVFLDEEQSKAMRETGVRDSKSLRPEVIQRLAAAMKVVIPVHQYHVLILSPETYNQEYERHKNSNLLLAEEYAHAAQEVWRATHSSKIVCDQFSQRADRLESAFAARHLPPPIQQHHAENASTAVAAASILASAAFAEAMRQLGERAGIGQQLPKGASDLKNLTAAVRHIIQTQGTASLGQFAKLNFGPIQDLLTERLSSPHDSASDSV